jgi:hypothetical protein
MGAGYATPFLNLKEQHGFGDEVRPAQVASSASDITDSGDSASSPITATDGLNPWQPTNSSTHQALPEPVTDGYRWALQRPIVLLPGLGSYPAQLTLKLAGSPLFKSQHVDLLLNGATFAAFDIKPGPPELQTFNIEATKFSSGSLAVELRVTNQGAAIAGLEIPALANSAKPSNEGFKFYDLKLEAQASSFSLPPLMILAFLVLSTFFFYFSFAYLGLSQRWAVLSCTLLVVGAALLLATYRLELTVYAARLVLLLFTTALLLPILDLLLPRLLDAWQISLTAPAWKILLLLFVLGLVLRGGGMLYPQTVIIDSPAHLLEINKILQGQLVQEYLNKDLSKVPGQWQSSSLIPYPTIPYFILAPFGAVGDPIIGISLFTALLDALRVFVIFGLAIKLGTGIRAALVAACLYMLVPATWLLNSWGNWPTTLSLWLATFYLLLVLVYYPKLQQRKVWVGLTLFLALTMITYTVTAVFVGLLLLIYAAGLFLVVGRSDKIARRTGSIIALTTLGAAILAVALYYWQFVGDILFNTLPSFGQQIGEGNSLGFGSRSLSFYYGIYTDHIFNQYGVGAVLTVALAVYGFLLFAPRSLAQASIQKEHDTVNLTELQLTQLQNGPTLWFMGSWFSVFVLFGFVGWKVDMVDKQVWFIMPLTIVLAGVGGLFLWQKLSRPTLSYAGRVLVLACALWLTYSAASLWIYRLVFKRH